MRVRATLSVKHNMERHIIISGLQRARVLSHVASAIGFVVVGLMLFGDAPTMALAGGIAISAGLSCA